MKTSITWLLSFGIQWNPVNADAKGAFHSVRIVWVSVLSWLWEKMSRFCPRGGGLGGILVARAVKRRVNWGKLEPIPAWLISVLLYNRCFLYLPKFTSDSSTVCSILNPSISPPSAYSFIYLLSYFNTYLFTDLICSILVLDLSVLLLLLVFIYLFFFLQRSLSVQVNVVSNLDLYVFGKIFPAIVQQLS